MANRPNTRNWNDVQTAIATVAVVTTLGLWNLFATPSKPKVAQSSEPMIPPTEPPVEPTSAAASAASVPTAIPQVKIVFAQATPTSVVPQPQASNPQVQTTKKKRNNGGGGTVTQTKSS
jgi:hypothetical protein